MKRILGIALALIVAAVAAAVLLQPSGPRASLRVISGSENAGLEPLIVAWAEENRIEVTIDYKGSVDIARELGRGTATEYDAVWPANSLWIALGDTQGVVRHRESILRSPIVLGLRQSVARDLGWIGRGDITIQMIQEAAGSGAFRLAMTSATQSNSGASAYIGFLYALAGDPDLLTMEHLADPKVLEGVRDLLAQVDRSSGSSGWLKDALLASPDAYDAMFNYEAIVLEANVALTEAGREPLHLIYPANGLSVADSPLGFVAKGDADKEAAFLALQAYLLSPDAQASLLEAGRRAGLIGLSPDASAPIWNAGWGADPGRSIASVPIPDSAVIAEALRLYQTELRKPSLTVWVLDVSGSMEGAPLANLKAAMRLLLDPEAAAVNLLQPSARDVTIVLPFNHSALAPTVVRGNDPAELARALAAIEALKAEGGTDLYGALGTAMNLIAPYAADGTLSNFLPAVVAMTDGASSPDNRSWLLSELDRLPFGHDVAIHAISFGEADETQLEEVSRLTTGRLFRSDGDLTTALQNAKGYN